MRIITKEKLNDYVLQHPGARKSVSQWIEKAEKRVWRNLAETRATFPHADEVRTNRGNVVTVFNIGGNNFRLITAIHYRGGRIYIRELLTHADYDKGAWKDRS